MLTKHEETILHDLAALLNEARALGLAEGEIYTIPDMQEEGTYDDDGDHRMLTEQEARAAVQSLIRTRRTQDRLIDVDIIIDCIDEAMEETAS